MKICIGDGIYDLTEFANKHPGGRTVLENAVNCKDVQALVETYHSSKTRDMVYETLKKYRVGGNPDNVAYDFTSYRQLKLSIEKLIPYNKATFWWFIKVPIIVFIYSMLMYGIYNISGLLSCIFAFLAGWFAMAIGFNVLHDGLHYGILKNPKYNEFLGGIVASWILWHPNMWYNHHTYKHHSFTGDVNLDPDPNNFDYIIRHPNLKPLYKYQNITGIILVFLFPGLWGGLLLSYYLIPYAKLVDKHVYANFIKTTPLYWYIEVMLHTVCIYVMVCNSICNGN